ncbi:MAG: energy-coupling factor transporter ATPase [Armatimonadetes bacterium]|nr:energy-coupling factor transporter ATPase [Armatimonadota bacterium]
MSPRAASPDHPEIAPANADAVIACEDVSHVYQAGTPLESVAVQGVSLRIGRGEFVGIVGPTGSGKSTLVQHFNGLLRPTSGRVIVAGESLDRRGADVRKVRRTVGLLFQYPEHQLFEETVARDVAFGPRNLGLDEEDVEERVTWALRLVGLDPERFGPRSPFSLSGGEMRRVAIAGVLAMKPAVLVLDEPTAGLDPVGRREILDRVQSLRAEQKITIVLVAHSMDDVARLCERIVVLHQGRVALDAPTRAAFSAADRLREIGLDVPRVSDLLWRLRAGGLPVRTDRLTVAEAVDEIARTMRAGASGGRRERGDA